jgi:hypothetical protein
MRLLRISYYGLGNISDGFEYTLIVKGILHFMLAGCLLVYEGFGGANGKLNFKFLPGCNRYKVLTQRGSCTRPMYERKSVIIPDSTLISLSIEEVANTAKPIVDRP